MDDTSQSIDSIFLTPSKENLSKSVPPISTARVRRERASCGNAWRSFWLPT